MIWDAIAPIMTSLFCGMISSNLHGYWTPFFSIIRHVPIRHNGYDVLHVLKWPSGFRDISRADTRSVRRVWMTSSAWKCYWESLKDTEIRIHSLAKSMAWGTRNVTPMRKQLSYVWLSFALSHRYGVMVNIAWRLQSITCTCVDLSPVGAR